MRRVVIGENKEGKSVVLSDDKAPRNTEFDYRSDKWTFMSEIWATDDVPTLPVKGGDLTVSMPSITPPPGGTRCRVLFWPPPKVLEEIQKIYTDRGSGFFEEFHRQAPGIHGTTDNTTGMHTTDTIDYGYFASGEIDLELDDGKVVHFKAGDSYVLQGTRHAWHHSNDEPCVLVVFMIGTHKRA